MKTFKLVILSVGLLFSATAATAQTGGDFGISQSVVASGGASNLTGGAFSLGATAGQSSAGNSSAGVFGVRSGFWNASSLAPTAARVSVGGRAVTASGAGIRNVFVTLTDSRGAARTTFTGTFGMFRFDNVEVGENYVLTISAKKYIFSNPTRVISVSDEISDADFVADPF